MLAVLDEALLLLADGVAPEARMAPAEAATSSAVVAPASGFSLGGAAFAEAGLGSRLFICT